MPEQTGRFEWIAKLAFIALIASLSFLGLAALVTLAGGTLIIIYSKNYSLIVPYTFVFLGELLAGLWCFIIYGVLRALVESEFNISKSHAVLTRAETLLEGQSESLKSILDVASLSDQARSLLYREKCIEAIRETINEDFMKQDYGAAEILINELEKRFGYIEEADKFRDEMEESKKATLEEKIDAVAARIQGIIDAKDWNRALREAQRAVAVFPGNPKVAAMPERIEAGRNNEKRGLLQRYGEAVRKNDIDLSIDLLKQLDSYLSPQEAAALQESARGVFRAKLHNLGVQFAICVTDQRWADAISTGESIIEEFPNSRMAQEVRTKMETLRANAAAIAAQKQASS